MSDGKAEKGYFATTEVDKKTLSTVALGEGAARDQREELRAAHCLQDGEGLQFPVRQHCDIVQFQPRGAR